MDTSKEYIKMCDCDEIQGNWKPREWDCIYSEWDDFGNRNKIWRILPDRIADSGVYGLSPENYKEEKDRYTKIVFLPLQHQLQEMVKDRWNGLQIYKSGDFGEYYLENREYDFKLGGKLYSMEQLWLAFVMKEKHSKIWSNGVWAWVNNESINETMTKAGVDINRE